MLERPTARSYRKRPVVIEAMGPITHSNAAGIAHWCGGMVHRRLDQVAIATLEGTMIADLGDYVIRGVKGEHYPCKPDIFAATYTDAEAEADEAQLFEGHPCDAARWLTDADDLPTRITITGPRP